ncbi:PucR family transcriptional regulator [Robertmurraya massiliosenegalensis]|uniref:PucR family transcriptional regulator n=1 Tax=Robertmurraya massiliosenegalensis TaxID=1287657 RepID=UPI0002E55562|nr:helix-turn-helix domain-containing protein [Robertmurraya massiliosenegalensis]
MFKKIHKLYVQSILFPSTPDFHAYGDYFWLHTDDNNDWLGIPKNEISSKELALLKTMYHIYDPASRPTHNQSWHDFLLSNGEIPFQAKNSLMRMLHFTIKKLEWDKQEVESALQNSFISNVSIVWIEELNGVILEEMSTDSTTEIELDSIISNLESDLFIQMSLYIGKTYEVDEAFPEHFLLERKWFKEGIETLPSERIYRFEKVFPVMLVEQMSNQLKRTLVENFSLFKEEPELLKTIKIFIENSLNVSLTAKKMYIHRNTLQYRIDRFTEKTGINLKDYHQVSTVYFACLVLGQDE